MKILKLIAASTLSLCCLSSVASATCPGIGDHKFCTDKPLGNPRNECERFGLKPQGKDDNLSGRYVYASQHAYLAIVKSGNHGCGPGQASYAAYGNVYRGKILKAPSDQDISHVTYCYCR